METLTLEFKTNQPKIFIYKPKFLIVNAIKLSNYIIIYKCHTN
jgi:hypothetical protein